MLKSSSAENNLLKVARYTFLKIKDFLFWFQFQENCYLLKNKEYVTDITQQLRSLKFLKNYS
jgi:hypothetical protein